MFTFGEEFSTPMSCKDDLKVWLCPGARVALSWIRYPRRSGKCQPNGSLQGYKNYFQAINFDTILKDPGHCLAVSDEKLS